MMSEPITSFTGRYRFLSNFYEVEIWFGGRQYPTVEHAYQAAKTDNVEVKRKIQRAPTPGRAKALGKRAPLVANWDLLRLETMEYLLRQKFKDPTLRKKLIDTGDARLVEGNTWNDTFWGQCPVGTGMNHLGKLLMSIRRELRGEGLR